ncbi:hypothetical protein ZTR_10565 [Talaromyces verruculosus]|nr:hypothetical protein ZTR_10565 [Talaromyces verruculosus]
MVVSLLLAGFYVIGLVSGDDSTGSAGDATITPMITANPTYTVLAPTDSPTLDLFGSVTFIWSAVGYNVGGCFCRPSTTSSGFYLYTSWMQAAVTNSELTSYTAEYLGSIMFASNFAEFPATCYFGMATDTKDGPGSTGGGDLFVELTSFPGGVTVSMPMTATDTQETGTISSAQKTAFITATSTLPPTSTIQPTGIPPPPLETIPEPEASHDLSGGAIAGVVGSVSGAFILLGLAVRRKAVRRKTSTPETLLSGFEEAIAPIKADFRKKPPAGEPTSSSIERGDVVHEMSVPDQAVRVFELESPPQRYTNALHELPES